MSDTDELWGGVISSVELDLALHSLTFAIVTLTHGQEAEYRLSFSGLVSLHFSDESSDHWDYVELTEIRVSQTASGQVSADLVFWSEGAGCKVVADAVTLRGVN